MKYLLLVVISIFCSISGSYAKTPFQHKCKLVTGGDDAYDELSYAGETFAEAARRLAPLNIFGGNISEFSHDFCKPETQEELYPLLETIAEKLTPCLQKEELYLKDFLPQVFNYTKDAFCRGENNEWEILIESWILFSSTRKCNENGYVDYKKRCLPDLKIYPDLQTGNKVWSEADLCSDMKSLHVCVKHLSSCRFLITKATRVLLGPTIKWCKSKGL